MKKKALVIGGSGFLGSHLSDILSKNKFNVSLLDTKKSKYKKKNQKMILGNIKSKKKLIKLTKNVNIIFHFAGIADIDEANKNPIKTIETNIQGTVNVMEACVKNKIKKMIFASSIYALSEQGGFYSLSKKVSELIIETYSKKYNIEFKILRFGSLYGSRANHFNSIGKYINQAKKERFIKRFSDGNEVRNYINVKDAAELAYRISRKSYKERYFNLLGYKKYKVKDVLNEIAKELKIKKVHYNARAQSLEYHYKNTPFNYKPRIGKNMYPRKQTNLFKEIKFLIKNK